MERQWLIRTKNNHILGPVSKEKIAELIENGSLKDEDEICSSNGYWIFIRETELVQKYLYQGHPQTFNPVSEAKDVLSSSLTEEVFTSLPLDSLAGLKKKIKIEDEIDMSAFKEPWLTDKKIKFFTILSYLLLLTVLYYRHIILNKLKNLNSYIGIPSVLAQEVDKKKTFLIP